MAPSSSSSSSSCFFFYFISILIRLLFFYLGSHPIGAHNLSTSVNPLCLQDELSALLQFEERYQIINVSDDGPLPRPKTPSWTKSRDCCSWDGIECDENTGHVIVLDLGSSSLYGSIDNNSTLFQLARLERLNLSYNDFNYSHIPSRLGDLSRLTHLDLSYSVFSGQVPTEIFKLTQLVHLDLSCNVADISFEIPLEMSKMKVPGLRSLAQNLTGLEVLLLSGVNMSSQVPSILANLSFLRKLGMDECNLHGVFPSAIFNLPKLRYLDVSFNQALIGRLPDFNSSSPLEELRLSYTLFSGKLPASIGKPSLSYLDISGCQFSGSLPASIGNLPSLSYLDISGCQFSGSLPASIGNLPSLSYLDISHCQFLGLLPASIGNLPSLSYLDISGCHFSGSLPSSIGNLPSLITLIMISGKFPISIPPSFANLSNLEELEIGAIPLSTPSISTFSWVWKNRKLVTLRLSNINLYGEIPPSIGNLSQLASVSLADNQLSGIIPSQLMNLTRLRELYLGNNQLSGSISSWHINKTSLEMIDLSHNKFHGEIPSSIYQLQNLEFLLLFGNNFSGTIELDNFLKLKQLRVLQLPSNRLSCRTSSANVITSQLWALGLPSCNLSEFPAFLRNQEQMIWLDLSDNNIGGEVPSWVWNGSYDRIEYLNLSHNYLTGLDQYHPIDPLLMDTIDLSHNMLKGPPPEAPPSIVHYIVSNNSLTGELPPWICNLSYASTLDLSSNNLTGALSFCVGNISKSLTILNLKDNNFHGSIPEILVRGAQLTMIDLSDNQLQGNLPRSLANCKMLEFINLANNLIVDTFPSWLGSLPKLRVLILRSNKFHGVIEGPISGSTFLELRILDLSINAFVGKLPMELFQSWNAMKLETGNFTYMQRALMPPILYIFAYYGDYDFSMIVIYKGLQWYYPKISEVFTIIDLSSNLFEGEIPSVIGDLKGLQGLNLSSNFFNGHIPSSLGNLTALESLDLSRNKLSGQIPQKLAELGFLSFLNMSYNNLTGFVPRGKQLDTFSNESFEGNPKLCGEFISRKCRDPGDASRRPSPHQEEDLRSPNELDWKIVLMGYGSGLVIGVVIGNAFISWKHVWFEGFAKRRRRPNWRQPRRGRNS